MNKAVFLDRDGVINRKPPEDCYVTSWAEMEFLPGIADAIALLRTAGYKIIVVSNQRCIAKGLITSSDLEAIHMRMCRELATAGAVVDAVYYCPHEKQPPCICRKPAPGMLISAAREHEINLGNSWMIGDSLDDIAAGKSAGCKTAWIGPDERLSGAADITCDSLFNAAQGILHSESRERSNAARSERNPILNSSSL